jgi:general secretion pathway protein D
MVVWALAILTGCGGGLSSFNKAQKLEGQGNLDEAVVKYAEVSAANPDVAEYRVRMLKVSEEAAKAHYKKGEGYLAEQKYDDALREFQTAFGMDASLDRASQMAEKTLKLKNSILYLKEGEEFEKNRKLREALRSYQKAFELNQDNEEAKEAVERLLKSRKPKLDGYELNLKSTKPITLKFKDAKIKEVFNIISQLSGISFIFDEGVKDVNVSIYLENATFPQALEILTNINKLGKKVLNESTIIIYPKSPEKTKQYEELMVQTFQLNKLDAKKAVNLIRTMLQVKKIYVNEEMNSLVIRDTPETIEIARKILEANDIPDAEVVLEVEVVEISKKKEDNFGFVLSRYAVSASAAKNGQLLSDTLTTPTTTSGTTTGSSSTNVTNLLHLFTWNGYDTFLTVPNATFNFAKTLASGETLANPRIRVKNREKAKFTVGTRVPITTTSTPSTGGITVNVQYVDVGVKMNAEPTIQLNDDINIKLSMEVSSIISKDTVGGSTSPTTVVTIGTRNLDTVLSLKDGETSLIGGLIQGSKTNSKQKVFLLGDIPIIGQLFTGTDDAKDRTELILAITPHIVRAVTVPERDVMEFWSGKEDEPTTARPFAPLEQEPEFLPEQPAASAPPAAAAPAATSLSGRAPIMPRGPAPAAAAPTPTAAAPTPTAAAPVPTAAAPVPTATVPVPTAAGVSEKSSAMPVAAPAASPKSSQISLNFIAPASININQEFSVEVSASDVADLYSAPFVLTYDPTRLEFEEATEGPLLKKDGKPIVFQALGAQNSGQITINVSRTGNTGGVSGTGTLATAKFKAKSKGAAKMGFSTVYFTAPGGKRLEVVPFNAIVEVK